MVAHWRISRYFNAQIIVVKRQGACLTVADAGVHNIRVVGPTLTSNFLHGTRFFIQRACFNVVEVSQNVEIVEVVRDPEVRVLAVPITPGVVVQHVQDAEISAVSESGTRNSVVEFAPRVRSSEGTATTPPTTEQPSLVSVYFFVNLI